MAASFSDYLTAIDRKLQIVRFHREQLVPLLDAPADLDAVMPPVPVQAHFEGVLRSLVAMFDQLVAGIADVMPGMPQPHRARSSDVCSRLRCFASQPALETADLLESLHLNPLLSDARSIRNQATHAFYEKYTDNHGWYVEEPRYLPDGVSPWSGERHLAPYTTAMLDLAMTIKSTADSTGICLMRLGCR